MARSVLQPLSFSLLQNGTRRVLITRGTETPSKSHVYGPVEHSSTVTLGTQACSIGRGFGGYFHPCLFFLATIGAQALYGHCLGLQIHRAGSTDTQSRSTTGSDTLLFASFYKTTPDQTNTLKHTQEPGYVTFVTSS